MSELAPQPLFWRVGSRPAPVAARPKRVRSATRFAAGYAAFAGRSDEMHALQQEACRVAAEGLQAAFARLLVYDADAQDFLVAAGVGWQPGVVGLLRIEADFETAAGFAWHSGEPVTANASSDDDRFRVASLLVEHGLTRSILVPIAGHRDLAFGVLEVASAEDGEFSADDACFLHLLAHSLAAARNRLMRQALYDERSARSSDEHQMSLHELQHRMRNDLQGICSSIGRETRRLDDAEQRAGYDRVSRRVLALAELYDHLLGMQSGGLVEMGAYLGALCLKIAAAGDLPARGIALGVETEPIGMTVDRAGRLAVAVNELVANAAEHAFPNGRTGTIMVRLFARAANGDGSPVVTVSDDGCGFRGPRPGSAGLEFVDRLVRGAGGVLTRLDGAGTEWRIVLAS